MDSSSRMKRRKSKKRFMDSVNEDVRVVEITERDTEYGVRWRQVILCGEP